MGQVLDFKLDDEHKSIVRDCLEKSEIKLSSGDFDEFVQSYRGVDQGISISRTDCYGSRNQGCFALGVSSSERQRPQSGAIVGTTAITAATCPRILGRSCRAVDSKAFSGRSS